MLYAELILGCMMSGKSSEMMRLMHRHLCLKNKKNLYIRSAFDSRHQMTHDNKTIDIETRVFENLTDAGELALEYDAVFVDETQFFKDAVEFLLFVEQNAKKRMYVVFSGLSGDSERKPWPVITNLIPLMNNIIFKKALCIDCGDGREATFSKCCVEKKDKMLIGNAETYHAVCRKHFFE